MKKRSKVHFPGLGLSTPIPESRRDLSESTEQETGYEYQNVIEDVTEEVDEVMGDEEEEEFDKDDRLLIKDSRGRPILIDGKPVYWTVDFFKLFLNPDTDDNGEE